VEHGEPASLYQKAAAAYLRAAAQGRAALLVSPTWAEIEAVTAEVRAQLRAQKQLAAKEEVVAVFDPLAWTLAQKQLVNHYEPGQQLRFVKRTAQFKAGESVEVVGQRGKQLLVRRNSDAGMGAGTACFSPSRAPSSFEVGQRRELAVAAGDWLLLRANAPGFVNGERVQVKEVSKGQIALADGRALPGDYRTFTHGYAVTSHAAQGKTVDEVFVVASSRSFAAVSQEQFYVSISRARERVRIFTDDAELLGHRVKDTHTRKAAVELQGLRDALKRAGFQRTEPPPRVAVVPTNGRVWRQLRALRPGRLAPAFRVGEWADSFRSWLGLRRGLEHATRQITARQHLTQRPEAPRQSRGIRM
jgi:hypothetical protein